MKHLSKSCDGVNFVPMPKTPQRDVDSPLYKIRHSLAHVMAQAVLQIRPGSKLGFGPPVDDGFYYDFILSSPITEEDFKDIEKRMKKILAQNQTFSYRDFPLEKALEHIEQMGEPYKAQYAGELAKREGIESIRFYQNGPFEDMCEGPHVENSKEIPKDCFKIHSVAGAYWRGDHRHVMMTRLYAWAFESRADLKAYMDKREEALKRDHKKLGKDLDIFHIDETVGKGLPLWLPNGTVIRDQLEAFMKELEFADGYRRVATPHITKGDLYYQTGHLPYYKDAIFPPMELMRESESGERIKESYYLRPMNCPHHHKIFSSRPRSYRELPLRLAEYGHVYRYEESGAVSGLLRVRGMCMNDAHIYCTKEQVKDEFLGVMRMHQTLYDTLGLKDYYMRFSTWDPEDSKGKDKYMDDPEGWETAQNLVREAMEESGLPFEEQRGEAAFYGPKIDFQYQTVTGREETISTNQLDFGVAAKVGLVYKAASGEEGHPYIIHRAPAGTHERFVAFLIEHFGGAFPLWLAPVQVKIICVADKYEEYGRKLLDEMRAWFIRVELDTTEASFNKKIRLNIKRKIPCLLILGEREMEKKEVSLRRYGSKDQTSLSFSTFLDLVSEEIRTRALAP
ncbi:MAG: threonine--tRNA ligase [Bacteriovoracales bacterium]|nr:threonine--tRNA ligase [Bacteriovoracales bacterium]